MPDRQYKSANQYSLVDFYSHPLFKQDIASPTYVGPRGPKDDPIFGPTTQHYSWKPQSGAGNNLKMPRDADLVDGMKNVLRDTALNKQQRIKEEFGDQSYNWLIQNIHNLTPEDTYKMLDGFTKLK